MRFVPYGITEHPPLVADGPLNICQPGDGWYCVQCVDCYAMGPRVKATKAKACEKAIAAWNKRTIWA